jgi:glycosyltransferase involved in cell wall biosynthesis
MEAMAAGLPCVSTHVNGSDTLLGGQPPCGHVVPREDPAALADALADLLADRERAAAWGARAAARIREHYTLEHMLDRLLEVYREVAA